MVKKAINLIFAALLTASLAGLAACHREGPAEKAGKNIDEAATSIKESVTPAGPAEKAGRKVDQAGRNVKDSVNQ